MKKEKINNFGQLIKFLKTSAGKNALDDMLLAYDTLCQTNNYDELCNLFLKANIHETLIFKILGKFLETEHTGTNSVGFDGRISSFKMSIKGVGRNNISKSIPLKRKRGISNNNTPNMDGVIICGKSHGNKPSFFALLTTEQAEKFIVPDDGNLHLVGVLESGCALYHEGRKRKTLTPQEIREFMNYKPQVYIEKIANHIIDVNNKNYEGELQKYLLERENKLWSHLDVSSFLLGKENIKRKRRLSVYCNGEDWLYYLAMGLIDPSPPGQRDDKEGRKIWDDENISGFLDLLKKGNANLRFLVRIVYKNGKYTLQIYDGGNRNRLLLRILLGEETRITKEQLLAVMKDVEISMDFLVSYNDEETLEVFRSYHAGKALSKGDKYHSVMHETMIEIKNIVNETLSEKDSKSYLHVSWDNSNKRHLETAINLLEVKYGNGGGRSAEKFIKDVFSGKIKPKDPEFKEWAATMQLYGHVPYRMNFKQTKLSLRVIDVMINQHREKIIDWKAFRRNFLTKFDEIVNKAKRCDNAEEIKKLLTIPEQLFLDVYNTGMGKMDKKGLAVIIKFLNKNPEKYGFVTY